MKRALSFLLSIVILLGCVSLPSFGTEASAAETEDLKAVTWSDPVDTKISGGYPRMITAANGSLLMAYSAGSYLKIARSNDNGATWPAVKYAYDFSESGTTAGNPTPYFDVETKTLYLAFRAPSNNESGPYTASIKYITSTDNGDTWSEPVTVVSSTVSSEESYGGMWEPTIYRLDGQLRIFYSCDTVKESNNQVTLNPGKDGQSYDTSFPFVSSKLYQNIVMHTLDESTGLWSGAVCSVKGEDYDPYKSYTWSSYHMSRPGMQSISQLNDGTYVMAVENSKHTFADQYGQTRYPFVTDLYFSADGITWGNVRTVAAVANYYCAAPWVDTLPDGRLVISFQSDDHRSEPLSSNDNSHLYHRMKVIVSKEPVTNADKTTLSTSDFEAFRPLESVNSELMYNAWNSVYVDGYKVYAIGKVSSTDTSVEKSLGVCISTFDTAAEEIPAGYKAICTADDMLKLMHQQDGYMWGGRYILMADIDMADATLDLPQQPIGTEHAHASYFTGTFDGNDHMISGIDIKSAQQWTGLFGYAYNATIKDLIVDGTIESTYATPSTRISSGCGVIGYINAKCKVERVINYASITALGTAGGIIGYAYENRTSECLLEINDCANYGAVTTNNTTNNDGAATGGIVGAANAHTFNIEITGCYNYGTVSGKRYVGGILGGAYHTSKGVAYTVIDQCVNDGTVTTKTTDIGGIVGMAWYTNVSDCLNRGEILNTRTTSGGAESGGIVGRAHQSGSIERCINEAPVYSRGGAILGKLTSNTDTTLNYTLTNCYYSERYATDVTTLGTKLSQGAAALPSSYVGLDFDNKWYMDYGVPMLRTTSEYIYFNDSYTELCTAEDVLELMNSDGPFTGKYVLQDDIDLSEYEGELTQRPIGLEAASAFKGTFEGNGFTISGINITYDGKAALFGYATNATIRNLNIEGTVTSTTSYTALMCAVVNGTTSIDNCTVSGTVNGGEFTGGYVGFALLNSGSDNYFRITGSTNYASINSTSTKVGGFVGYIQHQKAAATSVISGCINRGKVESTFSGQAYVGGIVGLIRNCNNAKTTFGDGAWIVGCSNFGEIRGVQRVAGILPAVLDDKESECRVSNCANFGYIYAEGKGADTRTDIGGVVAVATNLNVDACVNYGRVEAATGKICSSVVGRMYNFDTYAPAEVKNCYDLSGQGLEVVGDPDNMVCDNYKKTYCKTFTQNIGMMEKYQGFDTDLWRVGNNGAFLANSHDECTPVYQQTDATYEADGSWKYWCPICGEVISSGSIDKLIPVYGDINGDRVFNNTDLTVLVRYLSGYSETTLALNLDPNGDGKTNNRDAIELIKALSE